MINCFYKILIFAMLIVMLPKYLYAYSCVGESSIENELKDSDVVIVGTVLNREIIYLKDDDIDSIQQVKYTIKILTKYKGNVKKSKNITIITGLGGGDCGFKFEVNEDYIIYADYLKHKRKKPKYLSTNICTRTNIKNTSEIAGIEKFLKPKN